MVGYDQCNVQGSHGASKHVELVAFSTHQAAVDFLSSKVSRDDDDDDGHVEGHGPGGFELVGLLNGLSTRTDYEDGPNTDANVDRGYLVVREDVTNATTGETESFAQAKPPSCLDDVEEGDVRRRLTFPVQSRTFARRTCLVVDRKPGGLPWSLAQYCTRFLHVPHCGGGWTGTDSTTWVTMEACVSIVLHEFAECFDYHNSNVYQGQKYRVEQIYKGGGSSDSAVALEKQEERQRQRQEMHDETARLEEEGLGSPFLIDRVETCDY